MQGAARDGPAPGQAGMQAQTPAVAGPAVQGREADKAQRNPPSGKAPLLRCINTDVWQSKASTPCPGAPMIHSCPKVQPAIADGCNFEAKKL